MKALQAEGLSDKRIREIAWHEAGHVVAAWLVGETEEIANILHAAIRPHKDISWGRVRRTGFSRFSPEYLAGLYDEIRTPLLTLAIIDLFGGPAGEAIQSGDADWFIQLCDDAGQLMDPETDLARAVELAGGDNPRAWKRLNKIADCVDDLFELPGVADMLAAIADELLNKEMVSGDRLVEICSQSPRSKELLGVVQSDAQWFKRLGVRPWRPKIRPGQSFIALGPPVRPTNAAKPKSTRKRKS